MSNILDDSVDVLEWLDDYGLDPYEFRVLLRIARRYQSGFKNDSLDALAEACKMSKIKCVECIEDLLRYGLLTQDSGMSPEEIKHLLSGKTPQKIDGASSVCEWCKGTTFAIQEHHYPASKAQGGSQVVLICANCHYEFHQIEKRRILKPSFTFPWKECQP